MAYQADERYASSSAPTGSYYVRPESAHGVHPNDPTSSPDRLQASSNDYKASSTTPNPPHTPYSHDPSQPPMTPVSGPSYHQPHPTNVAYYGPSVSQTPHDGAVPSPPLSSSERPPSEHFTQDGNPIVPVGISGGKMFQCRGYGECDKVFTRSEHLARHVR